MGTGAVTRYETGRIESDDVFPLAGGPANRLYVDVWWLTEKAVTSSTYLLVDGSS